MAPADQPNVPLPPPGRDPRYLDHLPTPNSVPAGGDISGIPAWPLETRPQPAAATPTPAPKPQPAPRARRSRQDLTTVQRQVNAADEAAFAALELELGGRPALAAILAGADLNHDEAKVAGLLADPANDKVSLAKVCVGANLSMTRLMKLFQAAALAKGQTKAIVRIAAQLPDVAAGVMEDAIGGDKTCRVCNGFQFVPKPTKDDPDATAECGECRGKGTIYHQPDADIREIALRIGGLLDKGGSGAKILIANQNNGGGGGVADSASFDKLMAAIDGTLYGEGRARQRTSGAVDGEVVE